MLVSAARFGASVPFSAVVFLSGFEGTDGATTATDESGAAHAVTLTGTAQIDTAQFKYGTSSLLCAGSGDRAFCADHADWDFGTGAFTVEGFYRFNDLSSAFSQNCGLVSQGAADNGNLAWAFHLSGNATTLVFEAATSVGSAASITVTGSFTPSTGVWYHLCAERDLAGVIRVYADGVMLASTTDATAFLNSTEQMRIGFWKLSIFERALNGWADEVRITNGAAQYGSDAGFSVPAAAFPRS